MPSSRLPHKNRCPGLAERPDTGFRHASVVTSEINLQGTNKDLPAKRSPLDREALSKQLEIACRLGAVIERVAARYGLLPSIIAGFCSRRSGFGLNLHPHNAEGTRDFDARPHITHERWTPLPPDGLGFVRGLMGLDFDEHAIARKPHWRNPADNIDAAFSMIAGFRISLRRRTTLQGDGLLRASFAAFECGQKQVEHAIRLGLDVDNPTVAQNPVNGLGCGRDVLARADFFQAEGWD